MAVEATRRWANAGIFANALNPGAIPTNLQKHVGGKLVTPPEKQKTTQQGAATSVFLATSRQLKGIGGRYFEDCSEATSSTGVRITLVAVSLLMLSIRKMPSDFGTSQRQCWRRNDGSEFQNCLALISSNSSRHTSLKLCNRFIVPSMAISRSSTKLLSGSK
jgi:hypothetical protein